MKYFRSYPYVLQLLLFLLMTFTFLSFAGIVINVALSKLTAYSFEQVINLDMNSPRQLVNTSIAVQGIGNFFTFLLPGFLFAYLSHPSLARYAGLRRPGKNIQWLLVALVILGAMPVLQYIETLISYINFSPSVKAGQAKFELLERVYFNMQSPGDFALMFICMAVTPAIGEELFFRGVLMRFARKRSRGMLFPITFTALIFAYAHANIYGYLPIFLAGTLLGVIYWLTGSLLCSMLAHLIFNGFQIALVYAGRSNAAISGFVNGNSMPYGYIIGGALLFAISFYLLLKNKTPLPEDWADDFAGETPEPQN